MSKIQRITVSNLKAVASMTADFNGCTAIITGANNKGKTTFLRGITDRLRGIKPSVIVKDGEKDGFAELVLTTGERFIWTFDTKTKAGEKLTFITEREVKSTPTKEICQHYFPETFDVDKFLNSAPAKQRATLQKLTGIDFTEFDKLYKDATEERTFRNRNYETEKAKAEFVDPTLPKVLIPIDALQQSIATIDSHNMKHEMVVKGIKDKKTTLALNNDEIADLEKKIAAIKERNTLLELEISNGDKWLANPANQVKSNKEALQAELDKATETNKKIEVNIKAVQQDAAIEKARSFAEDADKECKRLLAEKDEIIKNASMPEGFGFSDDGITYKGFEFTKEQLSSSGIYIAALKLAALTLGEVKTLHFDASFLDKNNLAEIEQWANENDLQLLIERPDFQGGEIEYQIIAE